MLSSLVDELICKMSFERVSCIAQACTAHAKAAYKLLHVQTLGKVDGGGDDVE